MEYADAIPMFEKLKIQGEETPLDIIPKQVFSYEWYMKAYGVLSNSSGENWNIPLSELIAYKDGLGLIGSFDEFVCIIYAISKCYKEHYDKKDNKQLKTFE